MYSTRAWLALEIKGIEYDTVLVDAENDGFDFDAWKNDDDDDDDHRSQENEKRPSHILNLPLPLVRFPFHNKNDDDDDDDAGKLLQGGADEQSSLTLLQKIDRYFPNNNNNNNNNNNTPSLFQPLNPTTHKQTCSSTDVTNMIHAFSKAVPSSSSSSSETRMSPRAGWLFRSEEGYRLDALPRERFEMFLDDAERYLSLYRD
eukprot:15362018-Ditylum_brightwellii.AAC.1